MINSGRVSKEEAHKIAQECKDNIDSAVKIYLETDPNKGKKSEERKFIKAIQTISLCHGRAGFFTQWAESHIIGYYQNCVKEQEVDSNSHEHESFDSEKDICAYRNAIGCILDKHTPSMIMGYNAPAKGVQYPAHGTLHPLNDIYGRMKYICKGIDPAKPIHDIRPVSQGKIMGRRWGISKAIKTN